jgi:3-phytase
VAASEQLAGGVALFGVDPVTGRLTDIAAGPQAAGLAIAGLCMYRSQRTGSFYAFGTESTGLVRQWELYESAGRVAIRPVRDLQVGSTVEGCAADDVTGALYVAEEDVALWRYDADPDGGDRRRAVARIQDIAALRDDLEGISILYGADGSGYVVVSSQGNNSYAVFARDEGNRYLGSFGITTDDATGIDGTSDSDGIDVVSAPLGPSFPAGLFVAQDGTNELPGQNQNFKLVRWSDIADALGLEEVTGWDPRER